VTVRDLVPRAVPQCLSRVLHRVDQPDGWKVPCGRSPRGPPGGAGQASVRHCNTAILSRRSAPRHASSPAHGPSSTTIRSRCDHGMLTPTGWSVSG